MAGLMILSDYSIRLALETGRLSIQPRPAESSIQPASVDLHLADGVLDQWGNVHHGPTWLKPGSLLLASTVEYVALSADLVARVEGKSSLGRRGLSIHVTAGFIDPGFVGQITLEMSVVGDLPFHLQPGQPIAQVSFVEMTTPADRPYGSPGLGSHYQGQVGATPSWIDR